MLGPNPKPLLSRVIIPGVSDIVERLRMLFIWVDCGLGGNWVFGVRVTGSVILDGGVGGISWVGVGVDWILNDLAEICGNSSLFNCYLARSINSVIVFCILLVREGVYWGISAVRVIGLVGAF